MTKKTLVFLEHKFNVEYLDIYYRGLLNKKSLAFDTKTKFLRVSEVCEIIIIICVVLSASYNEMPVYT